MSDPQPHDDCSRVFAEFWSDPEQRQGLLSMQTAFDLIGKPMQWPISTTQLVELLTALHFEVSADTIGRWIALEQFEEPPRENGQFRFEPKHAEAIRQRLQLDERWRMTPSRFDEYKTPVRIAAEVAMKTGKLSEIDDGLRDHDVVDLLSALVNATERNTRRELRDLLWGKIVAGAARIQTQSDDNADVWNLGLGKWREPAE